MTYERIIVSRHPATIEFLQEQPDFAGARVVSGDATREDVEGKVVAGNLPLHLASHARAVVAVEFRGDPPRGREYSAADMVAAGAVLRRYTVLKLD